jgi:peptide/nickel transport system ATP-binding protein
MTAPVLELQSLCIGFATDRGLVRAVQDVSFSVAAGQMLAIVGESGCGKSVTALAAMGLLANNARIDGRILFNGADAANAQRGRDLAMVFQEPMTSLNPAFTAGEQVAETLRAHRGLSRRAALVAAVDALARVQIPEPERRARQYPHQLSGGMRQRVMIAMALACRPRLLICDEPTTALDVTVQAQIMALLDELRAETGTAILLITHDLGVVADRADHVAVMYAGEVVESAPAAQIFANPQHPYTVGLLGAAPKLTGPRGRLASIDGTVPDPLALPAGCRFAPRCPFARSECGVLPALAEIAPGHRTACWRAPLDQVLAV